MNAVVRDRARTMTASRDTSSPDFMSVKQVAEYLNLNEKKVYALVREQKIPATKITGKWVFPRELVDRWLYESSHSGLLTDRLVVAGSDDPLLYQLVLQLANAAGARGLVSYSPTGTRLGLDLLSALRTDVGCVHWGPRTECDRRHPALLQNYPNHKNWLMVRAFYREQGLMVRRELLDIYKECGALLTAPLAWVMRPEGAGTHRFLQETLAQHGASEQDLHVAATALSERQAAAEIVMGGADIGPGVRASATESGLGFISVGWEAFDFALPRGVYFRNLFQQLIEALRSPEARALGERLGGYDLSTTGELIWGLE